MKHTVELLAPAGNYEAFLGAINAGADAVYLGGEKFGARAYAENFDKAQILRALHVAHFYGKKVYLTVNTLLKEQEIQELPGFLAPFYEAGLDGVIVQDFGVFRQIRAQFPGLPLHGSTQMAVTGRRGAAFLQAQGAARIVPARELSLEEVREIKEKTGMEVECFIHGAMCYSYSGQCLFSSILGGRSGNRGRCAQPCRLPYEIWESENVCSDKSLNVETGRLDVRERENVYSRKDSYAGNCPDRRLTGACYPLSLKDMCTLAFLPALLEAGIDSLKIEGRMKRPEYAAGVTAIYRKYIDLYERQGAEGFQVDETDLARLKSLYIRSEIQTGYYERQNGREMVTLNAPGYGKTDESLLLEIRERYLRQPEKRLVRLKAFLKVGEPARLQIFCAADGGHSDAAQDARRGGGEESGWKAADGLPLCDADSAPREEHQTATFSATVSGEMVQPARKAPLTAEDVQKQLMKLGESLLAAKACEVSLEGDCFLPVRALNELRRQAVEAFEGEVAARRSGAQKRGLAESEMEQAAVTERGRGDGQDDENESQKDRIIDRPSQSSIKLQREPEKITQAGKFVKTAEMSAYVETSDLTVSHREISSDQRREAPARDCLVRTEAQLQAALGQGCRRIYVEADLFMQMRGRLSLAGEALYLALPYVLRKRDDAWFSALSTGIGQAQLSVEGFLVRNLEGFAFAATCEADGLRLWSENRTPTELVNKKCFAKDMENPARHGNSGAKAQRRLIVADAGLYCCNSQALSFLSAFCGEVTLPYELNAGEAARLAGEARAQGIPASLIVYSHIPMMVTANCVAKTAGACPRCADEAEGVDRGKHADFSVSGRFSWEGDHGRDDIKLYMEKHVFEEDEKRYFIKDRYDITFPVERNCKHCYNVIYNSRPYALQAGSAKRVWAAAQRYDFALETGEETARILAGEVPAGERTTGHWKRGVD